MTGRRTIDQLIINSPYDAPAEHWRYNRGQRLGEAGTFTREAGRRPAGFHVPVASDARRDPYDPGEFVELPLVNRIRTRVDEWRATGYSGATGITRRLLDHWRCPDREPRFFFCQVEAAETLIWWTETQAARKVGIEIPSDGGPFPRLCAKMATGAGKTVVMAMATAWQILNKVSAPQDTRFSRHVLVVAPGLTVRSRLAVLDPAATGDYYAAFDIVPSALREPLRRGRVLVRNWHALNWETEARIAKRRSVDKRGARSDAAYVRDVLGEMATARRILIINDEAHHAWRIPADGGGRKVAGRSKAEIEEATKWIGGLDRIARARGILACYDFSATPFTPAVKERGEALFDWTVSDFGLNDAIESGLVKTPRVVVRDDARADAKTDRSRLYHLYGDETVKDDLNRKAQPHEPLPDLVVNGYHLLGHDWDETRRRWEEQGHATRPVLITVTNRTETAARIKHAFDKGKVRIDALRDPERTLHIDSKVLGEAEASGEPLTVLDGAIADGPGAGNDAAGTPKLTRQERAELLRRQVDTVGKPGQPGERIQNVISVGMLSEGWDARTVTHIMGLRAFTSQLLCEQVVGRGLRRTSYDINRETGRFTPEHVNVFGIPFPFLPHEQDDGPPPPPQPPKTAVMPVPEKARFEITWPNVVRVAHVYQPRLSLDVDRLDPLELDARDTAQLVELAEVVDGVPDFARVRGIDLDSLAQEFRTQRIVFETAGDIYDQMQPGWRGARAVLLAQLVRLVERVIASDRIRVVPVSPLFGRDRSGRRLVITLNMTKVVQHLWEAIRFENAETLDLVLDRERPIVSTGDMPVWYTGRPCRDAERSHINHCVCDSGWEAEAAAALDRSSHVAAWVKNDHLGFEVLYLYKGVVRRFLPDFLIRLTNGRRLVLEVKGEDSDRNRTKRRFLAEWVRSVNADGRFGYWSSDVLLNPDEIGAILDRHGKADPRTMP